jgi:hypothetical protein
MPETKITPKYALWNSEFRVGINYSQLVKKFPAFKEKQSFTLCLQKLATGPFHKLPQLFKIDFKISLSSTPTSSDICPLFSSTDRGFVGIYHVHGFYMSLPFQSS